MRVPQAYSIGRSTRLNEQKNNQNPGPGSHNPRKSEKQYPQCKFGRAKRDSDDKRGVPGPGSYDLYYEIVNKLDKKASFKKKTKIGNNQGKTPGPGAYQPSNEYKYDQIPKYTFMSKGERDRFIKGNDNPGVGNYQIKRKTDTKKPVSKIGNGKRNELVNDGFKDTPGPAKYNNSRPISAGPQYRFGRENKEKYGMGNQKYQTPGPGQYNIKNAFDDSVKGKTLSGKLRVDREKDQSQVPGPGAYDPQKKWFAPGYKIGKAAQREGKTKEQVNNPGPGEYRPTQCNRPYSANYRIGNEQRKPLTEVKNTPGPGTYLDTDFMNTGYKYGIHGKKLGMPISQEDYPGPGEYQPMKQYTQKQLHSHLIGTSLRQDLTCNNIIQNPGPGQYQHDDSIGGHSWVIGNQKRVCMNVGWLDQIPGPGNYDIYNTVGECNKYSMDPDNLRSKRFVTKH